MDIAQKLEVMLYPCVRVKCSKDSGGSGTVIYSEPDPQKEGQYITLILTNHHVVESLITHKEEWNSLAGRKIEKEYFKAAIVQTFRYVDSKTVLAEEDKGRLVAYDAHHDLAILRVDSPMQYQHVAHLIPEDDIKSLRVFAPVTAVGCSLLHDPIPSEGIISYGWEEIEEQGYLMNTASIIFGNSGGALFDSETGHLIGVPSRVTIKIISFGSVNVCDWMGFAAHPARIYRFFREQELKFLAGDADDDYYKAMERREARKRQAILQLKAEALQHASASENPPEPFQEG